MSVEVESWGEYRKLVIGTLERLEASIKELRSLIDSFRQDGRNEMAQTREELRRELEEERKARSQLEIEFSMQKVRIGFLGAASGAIPGLIAALVWYLSHAIK